MIKWTILTLIVVCILCARAETDIRNPSLSNRSIQELDLKFKEVISGEYNQLDPQNQIK